MSKPVLYLIILALSGVVLYLLLGSQPDTPPETAITVSDPVITAATDSVATSADETTQESEVPPKSSSSQPEDVTVSGSLVAFVDDAAAPGVFVYALIDDGTEVMRVDLRNLLDLDSATIPEEQLNISKGQTVTVSGNIENGEFVATEIK